MKHFVTAGLAALLLAAAAVATGSASAMPKPGFLPGTWIGKGTISGSVSEYGMNTEFNGALTFTLAVNPELIVGGSGSWKLTMLGKQDALDDHYAVSTKTIGTAKVAFNGPATKPTFSGMQHIVRLIGSAGHVREFAPLDRKLTGRLVISRAGKCKVHGVTPIQPGVSLTWSAQLKGSGTCNA
jgi:hypothetical protein